MTIHFDPITSQLRLDSGAFSALRELACRGSTSGIDPQRLTELRERGVLRGSIPHPSLAYGLDAVAAPLCRLELRVDEPDQNRWEARRAEAWVGLDATALLLDAPEGLQDFRTFPVTFLPLVLGQLVALGPRPRPPSQSPEPSFPVPIDALELLVTAAGAAREQAMLRCIDAAAGAGQITADAARDLFTGVQRRWELVARWDPAHGEAGQRALRVIDSEAGLWRAEPGGSGVTLSATTPTTVWQAMIDVFPRDHELLEPRANLV
jgi:hypothetical protein